MPANPPNAHAAQVDDSNTLRLYNRANYIGEKSTASQMSISPETVRMHRKNLYLKLEVGSQSGLFTLFIEWLRRH